MKHKTIKDAMFEAKRTGKPQKVASQKDKYTVKEVISIRIDGGVLEEIKDEAEDYGLGYQTLINMILKNHVKKNHKNAG